LDTRQLPPERRPPRKFHRELAQVERVSLFERSFADLVLLSVMELAEADRPSIGWLHAHTCVASGSHRSIRYGLATDATCPIVTPNDNMQLRDKLDHGSGQRLMRFYTATAALAGLTSSNRIVPPLNNPAMMNIGILCRWDTHCIKAQDKAMQTSLRFIAKSHPPIWKIHFSNRNASHAGSSGLDRF
jgi:hypothetical protein